jgi:hypothetical protein
MDVESDLISVAVKTVPDIFTLAPSSVWWLHGEVVPQPLEGAEKRHELFLYAVRAEFADPQTATITLGCKGCQESYYTLNQVGIALAFELPNDVFDSVIDFNIRESEGLKVKIELLERRLVTTEDMCHMQRFHR